MHDEKVFLHKTPQVVEQPPRIVLAGAYFAFKGKDFPPHRDAVWELHYYRQGHIQCLVGDEAFESQPGMMTMVPPHMLHSEIAWTDYANFFIHIDAPVECEFPRVLFDDIDQSMMHVCAAIVREQRLIDSPERQTMLEALSAQLLILLWRNCINGRAVDCADNATNLVRRAESILNERYSSSITIEEVADEVGVSTSYLREQFRAIRGITPMSYLQQTRLRHALSWLRHSNRTLESVATACGYDSASHLSRHVKRATGKSPGAIRTLAQSWSISAH